MASIGSERGYTKVTMDVEESSLFCTITHEGRQLIRVNCGTLDGCLTSHCLENFAAAMRNYRLGALGLRARENDRYGNIGFAVTAHREGLRVFIDYTTQKNCPGVALIWEFSRCDEYTGEGQSSVAFIAKESSVRRFAKELDKLLDQHFPEENE